MYKCLHKVKLANQPTSEYKNDGLNVYNIYVTAALKCVPPGDKPTPSELNTCFNYFEKEISFLKNIKIIVALGKIGFDACFKLYKDKYNLKNIENKFGHGAIYKLPDDKLLLKQI